MKKYSIMLVALIAMFSFSSCGSVQEEKPPLTAEQVVNYFAQEGMPIGNVVVYTEESDVNNMLGRPGGYSSKVNFEDERTLSEYIDVTDSDYSPDNTLEIFEDKNDAKERYDYIESITKGTFLTQYMYLEGTMLLRLETDLLPKEAEAYEALLKAVVDDYQAAVTAPKVTRQLSNNDEETVVDTEVEPEEKTDLTPDKHTVSGFDEATNQPLSFAGIDFSFPSYFAVLEEGSTESEKHYYPAEEDYFASLVFFSADTKGEGITQENWNNQISEFEKNPDSYFELFKISVDDNHAVLKSEKTKIADMDAWIGEIVRYENGNEKNTRGIALVFNATDEKLIRIFVSYDEKDASSFDYLGDFEKILNTASISLNEVKEFNFKETVVIDNDDCLIKLTEIDPDNFWGYTIKVELENKSSDKTYMFSVMSAAVNGVQSDPFFATRVAPGKKAIDEIQFNDETLKGYGITDFTDIELSFRVYDTEDYMADDVAEITVHVYPYGEEYAVAFVRDTQPADNVVLDNEYVTVVVTGYENDEIWGYTVNLYLVNKTDNELMFSVNNASVNGYMADPFWAKSVLPGKSAFSSMSWYDSTLEELGISQIEEIEFQLRIYNSENWSAADIANETIILKP